MISHIWLRINYIFHFRHFSKRSTLLSKQVVAQPKVKNDSPRSSNPPLWDMLMLSLTDVSGVKRLHYTIKQPQVWTSVLRPCPHTYCTYIKKTSPPGATACVFCTFFSPFPILSIVFSDGRITLGNAQASVCLQVCNGSSTNSTNSTMDKRGAVFA